MHSVSKDCFNGIVQIPDESGIVKLVVKYNVLKGGAGETDTLLLIGKAPKNLIKIAFVSL